MCIYIYIDSIYWFIFIYTETWPEELEISVLEFLIITTLYTPQKQRTTLLARLCGVRSSENEVYVRQAVVHSFCLTCPAHVDGTLGNVTSNPKAVSVYDGR